MLKGDRDAHEFPKKGEVEMKKLMMIAMIIVPMMVFGAAADDALFSVEPNDDKVLNLVSSYLDKDWYAFDNRVRANSNRLYVVDGRVMNKSGKSIYMNFPRMKPASLSTDFQLPKGIFIYVDSLKEYPEWSSPENSRIYKVRQVMARKVSKLNLHENSSLNSCYLDGKSTRLSKGFLIEVHDLYRMLNEDDNLFLVTIKLGFRGFYPVKNMAPAMFKAHKPVTAVSYDCSCKIDGGDDEYWEVSLYTKNREEEHFTGSVKKSSALGKRLISVLKDGNTHNLNVTIKYSHPVTYDWMVDIIDFKNVVTAK